jgi:hypothetical protein
MKQFYGGKLIVGCMTFLLTDLLKVMVQYSIPLEVKEIILQGIYSLMDVAKPFQYDYCKLFCF